MPSVVEMLAWPSCSCAIFTARSDRSGRKNGCGGTDATSPVPSPAASAAGCSTFVSSFRLPQGLALAIAEHQIGWRPPPNALSDAPTSAAIGMWTERNRSNCPQRLRRLDLPLEDRLAHRQRADVQIRRARQRSPNNSPILNPVAAMRLTIVRCGSSTCFSNFPKLVAGDHRGLLFQPLLRELHAPRGVYLRYPYSTAVSRMPESNTHELRTVCQPHR